MRDLFLATIIFGSLPLILVRPWFGIIMWTWVSLMNPHRLTWSFMYDMQVAMMIALVTLIGWVLTKEDRRIPVNAITVFMAVLFLWTCVTTVFAVERAEALVKWEQFLKVILMTYILLSLIKKEDHFHYLVWTVVVSIGFFSVKGGIFTVQTGGQYHVWGPPESFIRDNNALALAILMAIPLFVYLGQTGKIWLGQAEKNRWFALGMYACAAISLISVIGSYSRGGFLGMAAIAVLLWLRSKQRVVIGILGVLAVVTVVAMVPQQWFDRMDGIQNYEEDASAMGRLDIWGHAIRIANDRPIIGAGWGIFGHLPTYQRLSPETIVRNVHSIYFEMLATQGYVGLLLFLILGLAGLMTARKIKRLTRNREDMRNEYNFANMIQISLVAYAVAGTFQNLSTYDMYYTMLAMIALQYTLVKEKLKSAAPAASHGALAGPPDGSLPAAVPGRSFLRHPSG